MMEMWYPALLIAELDVHVRLLINELVIWAGGADDDEHSPHVGGPVLEILICLEILEISDCFEILEMLEMLDMLDLFKSWRFWKV